MYENVQFIHFFLAITSLLDTSIKLCRNKHTPKCHLRFFVDILKLWVIVTLSLSNITSRTKAFTISFRTGYPVYLTKNPVQVTLYLVGVKERVTALFLLLNTEA